MILVGTVFSDRLELGDPSADLRPTHPVNGPYSL
jgi:hypothetical protein